MRHNSLRGLRVLVLRPGGQSEDLAQLLSARGAMPVVVPAIHLLPPSNLGPLDQLLDDPRRFDWLVFMSANGVAAFFGRAAERDVPIQAFSNRIAAVGPKTKAALELRGVAVEWIPSRFTAETLAAEFPGPPSKVCLIRSENAALDLEVSLRSRGFEVDRVDAYRSEPVNAKRLVVAMREGVDAIAFTSASTVEALVAAVGVEVNRGLIASIGPATSEACRRLGLAVDVEANEHTAIGLAEEICNYADRSNRHEAATQGGGKP